MDHVVIVAAKRTPVGSFGGALSSLPAHELGAAAITGLLQDIPLEIDSVSDVIMGQVLTSGHGQNPARQASLKAGLPVETPAWLINQVCGSGLRSVVLGMQAIQTGSARIVVAGGQESMSQSTHCLFARKAIKPGHAQLTDTMISDGLWDIFNDYHMGNTAENLARSHAIDRRMQDEFAFFSQKKASLAQKEGRFTSQIVPVLVNACKTPEYVTEDEYIRHDTTLERIAALKPAFLRDGTVTAANASGINDGAAVVLLMHPDEARSRGLHPLARIISWGQAGVDPRIMGIGPVPAAQRALHAAQWSIHDLDLIESNEAFAAQAIAVNQDMGWDTEKVNVNGGAIAIGHPIGASGCRILVTLLHEMQRQNKRRGLATLCIGGGMGIAICVEHT